MGIVAEPSPPSLLVLVLAIGAPIAAANAASVAANVGSRVEALEAAVNQQATQLLQQSDRISDLERVVPKELELLHYNVLADQAGTNLLPWFCYGAGVTKEERKELHRRFYAGGRRGNKDKPNKGWPYWAEGVLSPERIAAVEAYDERCFQWAGRRERLWQKILSHQVGCRERSPDIMTLAECDHFADFWEGKMAEAGYGCVWRKRPRARQVDGCVIAWRLSTYELIADGGFDFGNEFESESEAHTVHEFSHCACMQCTH